MKYLVIPPHSDPTLLYNPPPGWQVYDLMHMFLERVMHSADADTHQPSRQSATDLDREARNRLLLLLAGQQILARAEHAHRRLSALGAMLSGLSTPASAVHLQLDDLELAHGSTESSADVVCAAEGDAPYMPELERAATELAKAERVRIYVDTDKQLPALVWLTRTLAERCPVELAGPYIARHASALQRILPDKNTCFVLENASPEVYVQPMFSGQRERLWWNCHREPANAWGGYIPLSELLEPEALLRSGLKVAVVTFTVLGPTVLDEYGNAFALADLCRGAQRLREADVQIVAEWMVGAPGVDEAQLAASREALEGPVFFAWLAGLRRFHWPPQHHATMWANQAVTLRTKEAHFDLARNLLFDAPGTIAPDRLLPVIDNLARTLLQRAPFSPGRVAGAYCVRPPEPPAGEAGTIRLDPDCAIVPLQGESDKQHAWFAVNLRLRTIIAIDHRLATRLASLQHFVAPAVALPTLSAAQRTAIVLRLCQQGILIEART